MLGGTKSGEDGRDSSVEGVKLTYTGAGEPEQSAAASGNGSSVSDEAPAASAREPLGGTLSALGEGRGGGAK